MIEESLQFFAAELNKYLAQKVTTQNDGKRVVLGNVARAYDTETPSAPDAIISNKAIISLVNIEEDRASKKQENFTRTDTGVRYKNPPLFLNLYMLIAVNKSSYSQSLIWLGHILQYFQFYNVFTPTSHPSLNSRIVKLVTELYTLNFEQVNHLWSTLGGKYLPSVMYKIRQVSLDEDLTISEGGFIREIKIDDKVIAPIIV